MKLNSSKKFNLLFSKIFINYTWMIYHFLVIQKINFPVIILKRNKYNLSIKKLILSSKNIKKIKNLSIDAIRALNYSKKYKCNSDLSYEQQYVHSIEKLINKDSFEILLNLASDNNILEHANNYLGSKPYLSAIQIYGNVENNISSIQEGSKLWHRDSNVLHDAEYYINLTKVNENNGKLQILKLPENNWLTYPLSNENKGWSYGYRFNDKEMSIFYKKELNEFISTNKGPIGMITFLDSGLNFHKGGDVIKGERIVVRITYNCNPFYAANKLRISMERFKFINKSYINKFIILKHLNRYNNILIIKFHNFLFKVFNKLRIYSKNYNF